MVVNSEANLSLAMTARWTASARAAESTRADRLFNDPWAAALAGEEGAKWISHQAGGGSLMVIRTHFFDGFLQACTNQEGIRQVVILAAGLDTRAYRLDWPSGTHIFELDQGSVLAYKQQVLDGTGAQPGCTRSVIAADLAGSWKNALVGAGFDSKLPAAWLLEGILFYLPNAVVNSLLRDLSELTTAGSRLGCDVVNRLTLTSPMTRGWIELQAAAGAPWQGWLDDPEDSLAKLGWQAVITQPGAQDAHFGRWTLPVIPVKMPSMPHQWYVTATKMH